MAKRAKTDVAFVPEGYSYSELRPLVRATLDAGLSVMLHGHPGVGKSTLAAEVAAELGLPLIDLRLAQREPAELGGVHVPDRKREQLTLLPPPWVREACERPALVFLDEINAAVTRLHQAVAYQIVLERRVGPFAFHPGTRVMAAGNLDEDNAIAVPLSSALNNRFAHFTLRVDMASWLLWAERTDLPPEILAYLRAHERQGAGLLYSNDGGDAFPTPRSWEMAGRVYRSAPDPLRRRAMSACIGPAAADRFFQYEKLYRRVSPARILAGKQTLDFTTDANADPSFIHAVLTAVAAWVGEQPAFLPEWAEPLMALVRAPGLEAEYQFVFLRDLKRRGSFTDHLRPLPAFRELASQLVSLHAGLYQ